MARKTETTNNPDRRNQLYAALISGVDFTKDARRPETIFRECWKLSKTADSIASEDQ